VHLVSEHIWCEDYLVRSFYLKNLQVNCCKPGKYEAKRREAAWLSGQGAGLEIWRSRVRIPL